MVGARLCHKHPVTGGERFDDGCPACKCLEFTLEPRHENGEGRQGDAGRGVGCGLQHHLRVAHHEVGRLRETVEGGAEFALLDDHAHGVAVENVANGLYLRQDEPSLGGSEVDGDDEDDKPASRHEVGKKGWLADGMFRGHAGHEGTQRVDAATICGTHRRRFDAFGQK